MAKSKEKKPKPKPPENASTVIEIKKTIEDRKAKLLKYKETATKDGKFNKMDLNYRSALKRLKRAQRKLASEAVRLVPKKAPAPVVAPVVAVAPVVEPAAVPDAPVEAAKNG